MFEFVTPPRLFRTQIHTLRQTLPGVLDGLDSSIHDARIATRRIREVLPLLGDRKRRKHIADLYSRFKRLGKSLGRVRDVDVSVALLASLETRMPHAAPSLVVSTPAARAWSGSGWCANSSSGSSASKPCD